MDNNQNLMGAFVWQMLETQKISVQLSCLAESSEYDTQDYNELIDLLESHLADCLEIINRGDTVAMLREYQIGKRMNLLASNSINILNNFPL